MARKEKQKRKHKRHTQSVPKSTIVRHVLFVFVAGTILGVSVAVSLLALNQHFSEWDFPDPPQMTRENLIYPNPTTYALIEQSATAAIEDVTATAEARD